MVRLRERMEVTVEGDIKPFERDMRRAENSARRFSRSTSRDVEALGRTTRGLNTRIRGIGLAFGAVAVAAGVAGLAKVITQSFRVTQSFSQALSTVQAVSRASAGEIKSLADEARRLGEATRFSAEQAAQGQVALARAGLNVEEVLGSTETALKLAQAGALELEDAATIISTTLRQFNLGVADVGRIADVMAEAANSANVTVGSLGEALSKVGPIAVAAGVELEQVVAVVSTLGDLGTRPADAGTAVRNILTRLQTFTPEAIRGLDRLGLTTEDVNVKAKSLAEIFALLRDRGLDGATAYQIFGQRLAGTSLGLAANADRVAAFTKGLQESEGTTNRVATIMDDNLNGAVLRLKSRWDELLLSLGQDQGIFRTLTDGLAGLVGGLNAVVDVLPTNTALMDEHRRVSAELEDVTNRLTRLQQGFVDPNDSRSLEELTQKVQELTQTRGLLARQIAAEESVGGGNLTQRRTELVNERYDAELRLAKLQEDVASGRRNLTGRRGAESEIERLQELIAGLNDELSKLDLVEGASRDDKGLLALIREELEEAQQELDAFEGRVLNPRARQRLRRAEAVVQRLKEQEVLLEERIRISESELQAVPQAVEAATPITEAEQERRKAIEQLLANMHLQAIGLQDLTTLERLRLDIQEGRIVATAEEQQLLEASAIRIDELTGARQRESAAAATLEKESRALAEAFRASADAAVDALSSAANAESDFAFFAEGNETLTRAGELLSGVTAQHLELAQTDADRIDILERQREVLRLLLETEDSVTEAFLSMTSGATTAAEALSGLSDTEGEQFGRLARALQGPSEEGAAPEAAGEYASAFDGAFRSSLRDSLSNFDDFDDLGDFFDNLAGGVASSLQQSFADTISSLDFSRIGDLLGKGLQGIFGGASSFLGGLFGGGRQFGGDVRAGRAYLVGEVGPELFVPGASGSIIPNSGLGGGVTVNAPLSIVGDVTRQTRRAAIELQRESAAANYQSAREAGIA